MTRNFRISFKVDHTSPDETTPDQTAGKLGNLSFH